MSFIIRDEVMMKKNIPEANTQAGYIFDECANEQFGLVHQSPIINHVDSNSSRTNKNHLPSIDSNQQQQQQQNQVSVAHISSF